MLKRFSSFFSIKKFCLEKKTIMCDWTIFYVLKAYYSHGYWGGGANCGIGGANCGIGIGGGGGVNCGM